MKLFARYLIRWQWFVMVMLVSMTGVALYGMTRLSVDPSNARTCSWVQRRRAGGSKSVR